MIGLRCYSILSIGLAWPKLSNLCCAVYATNYPTIRYNFYLGLLFSMYWITNENFFNYY